MVRFESEPYDDEAKELYAKALILCNQTKEFIELNLRAGRTMAVALTRLEECLLWIGKAIRDDQQLRQKK